MSPTSSPYMTLIEFFSEVNLPGSMWKLNIKCPLIKYVEPRRTGLSLDSTINGWHECNFWPCLRSVPSLFSSINKDYTRPSEGVDPSLVDFVRSDWNDLNLRVFIFHRFVWLSIKPEFRLDISVWELLPLLPYNSKTVGKVALFFLRTSYLVWISLL